MLLKIVIILAISISLDSYIYGEWTMALFWLLMYTNYDLIYLLMSLELVTHSNSTWLYYSHFFSGRDSNRTFFRYMRSHTPTPILSCTSMITLCLLFFQCFPWLVILLNSNSQAFEFLNFKHCNLYQDDKTLDIEN